MSKNLLRSTLMTAFGAMLSFPMLASASVVTNSMSTATANVNLSATATDTLAAGATTSDGARTETKSGVAQLAKFDAGTGVLTGVQVNLTSSVHKQTTAVTTASTNQGMNNVTVTASGTGSSTVQATVPHASTTSSSLNQADSCTSQRKNACADGVSSKSANYNFGVASNALGQYAGSGTFGVNYSASVTAETLANGFPSLATTTSTVDWTGTLGATYDYLLHAAQSFDGTSALTMNLDFGSVYLGDSVGDQAFSIFNGGGNRVGLRLIGVTEAGTGNGMFSTNLNTYGNIAAGSSQGFNASFLANQLGSFSTSYQLTLADLAPSISYAASTLYSNYSLTLNLAGNVIARPVRNDVPEPATLMLLGMGAAAFGVSRKRKA
jgi:hypothetical protein